MRHPSSAQTGDGQGRAGGTGQQGCRGGDSEHLQGDGVPGVQIQQNLIGKDEVGGSNPPSSSKNPPKSKGFGGFL